MELTPADQLSPVTLKIVAYLRTQDAALLTNLRSKELDQIGTNFVRGRLHEIDLLLKELSNSAKPSLDYSGN